MRNFTLRAARLSPIFRFNLNRLLRVSLKVNFSPQNPLGTANPLRSSLKEVFREMDKHDKGKHIHKNDLRFYKIQEPKIPKVDPAVAFLEGSMVIHSEGEFYTKDLIDRKMEAILKNYCEAFSATLRTGHP